VLSIGFEKFRFLPFPVIYDVIIWYIIFSGEGEEDIIKGKKKEKESIVNLHRLFFQGRTLYTMVY
jgi:hypothetical protein